MRIAHNISALNTNNKLKINNEKTSKTLEKLSSGYKVNRASDDSAGLSISEKMRSQIRGLNMVSKNIQDGISLTQVAEGGLNEVHSYLQRGRELAVQSANDTLTESDRLMIQKEIEQIKSGIDKIANNTEFNTKKLLNVSKNKEEVPPVVIQPPIVIPPTTPTPAQSSFRATGTGTKNYTVEDGWVNFGHDSDTPHLIKLNDGESVVNDSSQWLFTSLSVTVDYDGNGLPQTLNVYSIPDGYIVTRNNPSLIFSYNGFTIDVSHKQLTNTGVGGNQAQGTIRLQAGVNNKSENESADDTNVPQQDSPNNQKDISKEINVVLQIGANSNQSFPIELSDVTTVSLKINNIDISTSISAGNSISLFDSAIQQVSGERSKFGAYQNRLEYAYNSVMNTSVNLQSAESRIRDADLAKEMMELTKQNILMQVTQSMLSQSNQHPQSLLQLLQ